MESVIRHSVGRATEAAARLWALASAQYPVRHEVLCDEAIAAVLEELGTLALNARRAIEAIGNPSFPLEARRWEWDHFTAQEVVEDFRNGLNRVLHARSLDVDFVSLPRDSSVIEGGAVVIPFVRIKTDRHKKAFVDLFAMAYCWLYAVLPALEQKFPGEVLPPRAD